MKFNEIPQGCYALRCHMCGDYLALHPDDRHLADQAMRTHAQMCPKAATAAVAMWCTLGGHVHCDCAGMSGECCWCGAWIETA